VDAHIQSSYTSIESEKLVYMYNSKIGGLNACLGVVTTALISIVVQRYVPNTYLAVS